MTNNLMKKTMILAAALLACQGATANSFSENFEKNFADSTLRIDYIEAGNNNESHIFLAGQKKMNGWAGRRHNLSRVPYEGNGTVTVCDSLTGDTIYRQSFSTLFREWQDTDEARTTSRSFENSMLVPLPRRAALITTELLDNRHRRVASNTHLYSPADILVAPVVNPDPAPWHYIHRGGDPKKAIDIAILAEGFTPDEMEAFNAKAAETVEALFSHSPFKDRRNDFNIAVVETPSRDSGVSVPRDNDWKETAFGSAFDTFYSDRYLTSARVFDIMDAAAHVPFEHIIILANSDTYGGGGIYNSYELNTTGHDQFRPVVVHEFGHSFGGLADEYFYEDDVMEDSYPLDIEPWEPNITTLVDFKSKWELLLKEGTPVPTPESDADKYPTGVYEGGGYSFKGVYRPADHCRMRDNFAPDFCKACAAAINRLIDFYTK